MRSSAPEIFVLGISALLLTIAGIWLLRNNRRSPAERERRRRDGINRWGRMGDAFITDVREQSIFYTYEVRGVTYAASQDISTLRDHLPLELSGLVGPAGLKYHPKNPANSIVISEEWSGLRKSARSFTSEIKENDNL